MPLLRGIAGPAGLDTEKSSLKLYSIFLTAIGVQMMVWYYPRLWVIGDEFRASTFFGRIGLPLLLNALVLRFPLREMGFRAPQFSSQVKKVVGLSVTALILVVLGVHLSSGSRTYYGYLSGGRPWSDRAWSFGVFTFSTLTGWEILHRSFLLFGLRNLLSREWKIPEAALRPLLLAIVCSFEVLFHFQKPINEPLGMILASTILSWIALESRSVWIPMGLHFLIEGVFFAAIS